MRTLLSFRALIVVFGVAALAFPLALVAQAGLVERLYATLGQIALIRQSQLLADELERAQIDEETGIRGFTSSAQTIFLEPFERGYATFPNVLRDLRAHVNDPALRDRPEAAAVAALLDRMHAENARWIARVARPALRGDRTNTALAGKEIIDAFRADDARVDARLDPLHRAWIERRDATLSTGELIGGSAGLFVIVALLLFAAVLLRMRNELDREHAAIETLQTAISSTVGGHPELEVGSVYFSATRGGERWILAAPDATRNRIADDLAILAVRPRRSAAPV